MHRRKPTLIVGKLDFSMLRYRAEAGAFADDEILGFHAARSSNCIVGFEGVYLTLWSDKRDTSRELRRAVDNRNFLQPPPFRDVLKNKGQAALPVMSGQFEKHTARRMG